MRLDVVAGHGSTLLRVKWARAARACDITRPLALLLPADGPELRFDEMARGSCAGEPHLMEKDMTNAQHHVQSHV